MAASFHTIHFQSEETPSGMDRKEEDLLRETLPLVDALTVFTDGAYRAVLEAFPEHEKKIVILRHGVHLYPRVSKHEARKKHLLIEKELAAGIDLSSLDSEQTVNLGHYPWGGIYKSRQIGQIQLEIPRSAF